MAEVNKAMAGQLALVFAVVCTGSAGATASAQKPRERMLEALNTNFAEVNFTGASLSQVVDFLSREAQVNILIDPVVYASLAMPVTSLSAARPAAAAEPKKEEAPAEAKPASPEIGGITLRLKNVPLKVVLKYVLRYKNLRYIVEDYAIVIVPTGWVPPEALCTRVFRLQTGSFGARTPTR